MKLHWISHSRAIFAGRGRPRVFPMPENYSTIAEKPTKRKHRTGGNVKKRFSTTCGLVDSPLAACLHGGVYRATSRIGMAAPCQSRPGPEPTKRMLS